MTESRNSTVSGKQFVDQSLSLSPRQVIFYFHLSDVTEIYMAIKSDLTHTYTGEPKHIASPRVNRSDPNAR